LVIGQKEKTTRRVGRLLGIAELCQEIARVVLEYVDALVHRDLRDDEDPVGEPGDGE
jgi:hypothetical protein